MWQPVISAVHRRNHRKAFRVRSRPVLEVLEGRLVLDAALAALPDISVPAFQGYQVVLDGSGSSAPAQTFTATSSNPDIRATVAQGQFLTMNVSHQSSGAGDPAFSGNIVIQLFEDLTPNTAATIEGFISSGFYDNKDLFRVANGFPDASSYIIQGGSPNNLATGVSGLPGTPFANEIVPQLAFTNPGQLAMANTGQPNSDDTQFFLTTAAPSFLDNGYTIFGQVVSGLDLVDEMTQVALTTDPVSAVKTYPTEPIIVNTETLSSANPDGVLHIDFTRAAAGETATITVTANDPTTDTSQTQSFLVMAVASNAVGRPTANAQSVTTAEGTPVAITLTGTDPDTPPLALTYTVTTGPAHGTLSGTAPNLIYTPNAGYFGADSLQFTDSNGTLTSDPATVSLSVTAPAPGQPTANAQSATTAEATPVAIMLTGTDPNTPPLALTYTVTTGPAHGTLSGTVPALTYTPNAGYFGADSFQFTDNNGMSTSASATVALTVIGQPTANAQSVTTTSGTSVAITLTGTDPDTPPLALTYTVTTGPSHGMLSGTAPDVSYTPNAGYFGADSFQFTVSNGTLISSVATVALSDVGQPTARNQSVTTAEGTPVTFALTANDPDVPPLPLSFTLTASPAHGTLTGPVTAVVYTPNPGYFGPDSFQFTVSNGTLTSAPATVTLMVVAPPTANPQSLTTVEGTPLTLALTGSDPNTPPLPLGFTLTAAPAHGTLSGTATALIYTPAPGYVGTDSFQFAAINSSSGTSVTSAPATVSLTITPGPPAAAAVTAAALNGNAVTIQLAGSSAQAIAYMIVTQPTQGKITQFNEATGTVVYVPNAGAQGTDSFQYEVTNLGAPSPGLTGQPATVTINLISTQATVKSVQWQTMKVRGKKPTAVLVVSFSGAFDAAAAENPGAYHLIAAGKDRKLGTADDKRVTLKRPVYDGSANTVTLTPRGSVPKQLLRLTITATQPINADGRPSNGAFFQLSHG